MVTYDGGKVAIKEFDKDHVLLSLSDNGGLDGSPPEGHQALINKAELYQITKLLLGAERGFFGDCHLSSKTLRDLPDEMQPKADV
jgi:hypothetical protein